MSSTTQTPGFCAAEKLARHGSERRANAAESVNSAQGFSTEKRLREVTSEVLFNEHKVLRKLQNFFQSNNAYNWFRSSFTSTWKWLRLKLRYAVRSARKTSTMASKQSHSHSRSTNGEGFTKGGTWLRRMEAESVTFPKAMEKPWRYYGSPHPHHRLLGSRWSYLWRNRDQEWNPTAVYAINTHCTANKACKLQK